MTVATARKTKRHSPKLKPLEQAQISESWLRWESIRGASWYAAGFALLCLLPFLGEAFHIDDPLFLWTAKEIVKHPWNPYGFSVVWYANSMCMSEIAKNPPAASYFLALIGWFAAWSEYGIHLWMLLPTAAVIVLSHRLARDMTRLPLLVVGTVLTSPGFLVSATSVMCDVPMLAMWLAALVTWRKGLKEEKWPWLIFSGVLIAVCALTKYFGVCLIPLLIFYSIWEKRKVGRWAFIVLIPGLALFGYQMWTASLYGEGLLSGLGDYVQYAREEQAMSASANLLTTLSFAGGCILPVLGFATLLWPRRALIVGACVALGTFAIGILGWISLGQEVAGQNRFLLTGQFALFVVIGLSLLALAFSDFWLRRDSDSALLTAWVFGTFFFTAFLNWTVSARSLLPLIPPAAILIARRLERKGAMLSFARVGIPLLACLMVSLWVTRGDAELANSERKAAFEIRERATSMSRRVLFSGHWGFQYYMELLGGTPVESSRTQPTPLDILVRPENNTNQVETDSAPIETIAIKMHSGVAVMRAEMGAGFYSSRWGVLPYAFGPVPEERYYIYRFDQ